MRSMARVAKVESESGDPLGHALVLEVKPEPINRVLRKIARGLYYSDTNQILPDDVQILIWYGGGRPERFIAPPLDEAIRRARRTDYGQGVVTVWRGHLEGDPTASLTWLHFYQDKVFMVCTLPEGMADDTIV